jgi:hypothetical protein
MVASTGSRWKRKANTRILIGNGAERRRATATERQGAVVEGVAPMESRRRGKPLSAGLGSAPAGNAKHAYECTIRLKHLESGRRYSVARVRTR